MSTPPRDATKLSPSQLAKRDAIIAAAVEVLITDGVNGCTVRAISERAGISKGIVHYYFDDIDRVVDAAMLRATRAWIEWFRSGEVVDPVLGPVRGSRTPPSGDTVLQDRYGEGVDPLATLWQSLDACMEPFAHGDRALMPLWLEYWALRTRAENLAPLREMYRMLTEFAEGLLTGAGISREAERASGVTAYLFGIAMAGSVEPVASAAIRQQIAAICGVTPPL